MKTGIILLCRFNSSRLPGKILRKINGKPILGYIIERLKKVVEADCLIVATSEEETDNPIAEFCRTNDIMHFRGSLNNVAQRFKDCANNFKLDYAVRITGDSIFTDFETINEMILLAKTGKYQFISNKKGRTFPVGMSVEIVNRNFYNKAFEKFSEPEHFEHVTLDLYSRDDSQYYYFYNTKCPEAAGVQLAIDELSDFETAGKILEQFTEDHTNYKLPDVINILKRIK